MFKQVAMMIATIAAACSVADAAEIRLKSSVVVDSPIVRLGDVAEVTAPFPQEAEALAATELFPAPIPERRRYVQAREVIDLLVRRGVDFSIHRIAGSETIQISRAKQRPVAVNQPSPADSIRSQERKAAEERLRQVILEHFQQRTSDRIPAEQAAGMQLEFETGDDLIRAVRAAEQLSVVADAAEPMAGPQQLVILADSAKFPLDVQLRVPRGVVVAARPLARGAVVRAVDVRMEYESPQRVTRVAHHSVDSLVGKQLTTSIGVGRPIAKNSVREPIIVRRGDVVSVVASVGGVAVRTDGKVREDASAGAVIEIESLEDRERRFFARATGRLDPQTGLPVVEVFGGASTVGNRGTE
ncbi:MAG: flagellar basal body P-ring formation chaperone FlgA [Pirellulales bacterium]